MHHHEKRDLEIPRQSRKDCFEHCDSAGGSSDNNNVSASHWHRPQPTWMRTAGWRKPRWGKRRTGFPSKDLEGSIFREHGHEDLELSLVTPLPAMVTPPQASSSVNWVTEAAGNRKETPAEVTFISAGLGTSACGSSKVFRA